MSKPAVTLSIKQRLIALIVALTVALVGVLATYFTRREIGDIRDQLRAKATTYAQVVSRQTSSAVAFSDRETAREVLDSISADVDVDAVALVGSSGMVLYQHGDHSDQLVAALSRSTETIEETSEELAVMTQVHSLEGPTGMLGLSLSERRVAQARVRLIWIAVGVGAAAVIFALIAAWWIARNVADRLRAIASVATAVAGGDIAHRSITDQRDDEIGHLATAFNTMLAQIRQLMANAEERAHQEQQRLESLVTERTAALDDRNAEMRLVLDNVDQGLFIVDLDGTIAREHSAAVELWLGPIPASRRIDELVRAFAPERADWFAVGWEAVVDRLIPLDVSVAQLPDRFVVGASTFKWTYKAFDNGTGPRILVVITDITSDLEARANERDEREAMALISNLVKDRIGFIGNVREIARLSHQVGTATAADRELRHVVHTLKGVAGMIELESVAQLCESIEVAIAEGDDALAFARCQSVDRRWTLLESKIEPLVEAAIARFDVSEHEVSELEAAIASRESYLELAGIVHGWRDERVAKTFARLADQTRSLSRRFGKSIEVTVDTDTTLRLPPTFGPFWAALVHAIRNAIDHGIEDPAERVERGKPPVGTITLRASRRHHRVIIELADDGAGIDWDKLRIVARDQGLPADSPADLEAALFFDGVTTREQATELSGRGVGMAALRTACEQLGGHIEVESARGHGTLLRCSWPYRSYVSSLYPAVTPESTADYEW